MAVPETLLMVADSERDANMLFATGLFVPDPFIYLNFGRRPLLVLSDLEIDRARRQARHCRAVSLSACQQKLLRSGVKSPGFARVIRELLREQKVRRVTVPDNFPLGLARELKKLGIKTSPRAGHFFPEREIKSAAEVKKISAALMMAEVGMAEGMQVLRNSKIGRGRKLFWHNLPLTSEKLRAVIDCAILQACGLAANTIVAGGKQAWNAVGLAGVVRAIHTLAFVNAHASRCAAHTITFGLARRWWGLTEIECQPWRSQKAATGIAAIAQELRRNWRPCSACGPHGRGQLPAGATAGDTAEFRLRGANRAIERQATVQAARRPHHDVGPFDGLCPHPAIVGSGRIG